MQRNLLLRYLFLVYYNLQVIIRLWGWGKEQRKTKCVICQKISHFIAFGHPPRYQARCTRCGSLERHRLLIMADEKLHLFSGKVVLHFAPEPVITKIIQTKAATYLSADIKPWRGDICLNIENIDQPPSRWDVVLASHVLEHVDDRQALREIHRILRPGGKLIVMVPIIEAWKETYENPSICTPKDRTRHFGQLDHMRYYGRDFIERIKNEGFTVQEFAATGQECVEYALLRGEKVFICNKS